MPPEGARLGRGDVVAVAGLALAVPCFLWRLCLSGQILYGPDAFAYFYPMYEYAAERLASGELPLWNPYLFLGAPFLANPQAGVFYPVHWALARLPAPSLASATLAIHYALATTSAYLLARVGLGHRRLPAIGAGLVFGLSGLLGAQAEHFNQVEALAWLPLQALALEMGAIRQSTLPGHRRLWLIAAACMSALQLVIGHSQAAYIAHAALAAYAGVRVLAGPGGRGQWARRGGTALAFVGLSALVGAAVAAVQLWPTLELAGLSVRAGGLPYRQAVSFSFSPRSWLLGLLPHYGTEAPFSEYVAYLGVTGLGLSVLGLWRGARRSWWAAALAILGVGLALGVYNPLYYVLYRLLPGMDLFRAPARWLVMSLLGASLLVAEGIEVLGRPLPTGWWRSRYALAGLAAAALLWLVAEPRPQAVTMAGWIVAGMVLVATARLVPARRAPAAAVVILLAELLVASQQLPYNQTTAPQVYEAQRRSVQVLTQATDLGRFLSVSDPRFDTGDMGDLVATLGAGLDADGRYGLLVGAKSQEVLSRNLALHWRLFAADGYDGGVLPTADHLAFQSLYLPPEDVASDGRLSEALEEVPPERLLALASIEYVLQDRLDDLWLDGIHYDLSAPASLGPEAGPVTVPLPRFPTTELGLLVSAGEASISIDGGSTVRIGWSDDAPVVVGPDGGEVSVRPVPGRPESWHAVVPLSAQPTYPRELTFAASGARGTVLAAVSLINSAADAGTPVALSQVDGLTPVHLGDLRVSRVAQPLARAYFTSCVTRAPGQDQAMELLRDSGFDPREMTILMGGYGAACDVPGWLPVEVMSYRPEQVVMEVEAPHAGYIVLTDAFYPGWVAQVDGAHVEVERANVFFRAVPIDSGRHRVEFSYSPQSFLRGLLVSAIAVGTLVVALAGAVWYRAR